MIRRRLRALEAVVEQASYIAESSMEQAMRLIEEVENTLRDLETMPESGRLFDSELPKLRGLRLRAVRGFPNHLLFYRPIEGGIEFVHLLHAARDLGTALTPDD